MKNINTKLSALLLSTLFAAMQVTAADGIGNSTIVNQSGGLTSDVTVGNTRTLEFNSNTHVTWDKLNVGSGETLNFNAANGVSGLSILNTVNTGMSRFAGTVSANSGISNLIISNPNGVLFDGASFVTAGDCNLKVTTQNMLGVDVNNLTDGSYTQLFDSNGDLITVSIKDSTFNVGGNYTISAPVIKAENSTVNAKTFKLVTANGQDYLALGLGDSTPARNDFVTNLKAMTVNGDVVITNESGGLYVANGGTYNGNMTVNTKGNTYINKDPNTKTSDVTQDGVRVAVNGNLDVNTSGNRMFLRNADVKGNLNVTNDGGHVDVGNINVTGDANLTTTGARTSTVDYQHFVHVVGDSKVDGDLKINSSKNIHIGGYDYDAQKFLDGSLTVGGDLVAHSTGGHVMTTINTKAKTIDLSSDTHNVLSDGKTVLTADEYKFSANGYIGSLDKYGDYQNADERINTIMENYTRISARAENPKDLLISGGKVTQINTPKVNDKGTTVEVHIASLGDVEVTGANTGDLYLNAKDHRIDITGPNVHAKNINVKDETNYLKVDFPNRDYTLNYTNIRDGKVVTLQPNEEVTYELTDGSNGYNQPTLTPDEHTTYLIGPGAPGPEPKKDPENNNENARNLMSRWAPEDPAAAPVNTPVAFAADLDDDDLNKAVRKNVDGSVTVVRAFPIGK